MPDFNYFFSLALEKIEQGYPISDANDLANKMYEHWLETGEDSLSKEYPNQICSQPSKGEVSFPIRTKIDPVKADVR